MKRITNFKSHLVMYFLSLMLISLSVNAQQKPAQERANDLTQSMICELGLMKTQIPDVSAINLEASQKMDAAWAEARGNMKLYHQKGKEINKNRNIALRDVLTPDQFALYERISRGDQVALKKTAMCRKLELTNK